MWKTALVNFTKIAFSVGLIVWLIASGKLDLRQLAELIHSPSLVFAIIGYWLIGPCLLGSFRWYLLLKGAGYQINWINSLRLQLVGFFFNSAMPGAVGGDLIKVVYVIRDNREKGKSQALMSILLDRIIGLGGLFAIGLVMALATYETFAAKPLLAPVFLTLVLLNLGVALFFIAALYHYRKSDPFLRILGLNVPGFSAIRKLYEAARVYRYRRSYIIAGFGLSVLIQLLSTALFFYTAQLLLSDQFTISFAQIASIFPIGMLTAALPIAPGGLGVGHVAFDQLFSMVGLQGGANVFNLFVLSQLALNLLGIIPYLRMKKSGPATSVDSTMNMVAESTH